LSLDTCFIKFGKEDKYEELKETMRITLKEVLEFNRLDALIAMGNSEYKKEMIAV